MFPISSYFHDYSQESGLSVSYQKLHPGLQSGEWAKCFLSVVTSKITVSKVGQMFPISSYFNDYSQESGLSVSCQKLHPGLQSGEWAECFLSVVTYRITVIRVG